MTRIWNILRRSESLRVAARLIGITVAVALCVPGQAARTRLTPTPAPATGTGEPNTDIGQLKHLIAEYSKSVNDADSALASGIWSHSPDVSFIYPMGWDHGFDQIRKDVYEQAMGETFSERQLSVHDVALHVYGDAAWAEFHWVFVAKLRKDGTRVTTQGRETQIYRKEAREWRLVHVHYSGMPAAGARPAF